MTSQLLLMTQQKDEYSIERSFISSLTSWNSTPISSNHPNVFSKKTKSTSSDSKSVLEVLTLTQPKLTGFGTGPRISTAKRKYDNCWVSSDINARLSGILRRKPSASQNSSKIPPGFGAMNSVTLSAPSNVPFVMTQNLLHQTSPKPLNSKPTHLPLPLVPPCSKRMTVAKIA